MARLSNVELVETHYKGMRTLYPILQGVTCEMARLSNVELVETHYKGMRTLYPILQGVTCEMARLSNVELVETHYKGMRTLYPILQGVTCEMARLSNVELVGTWESCQAVPVGKSCTAPTCCSVCDGLHLIPSNPFVARHLAVCMC